MAVRDQDDIVAVSVFCDECEITTSQDYVVPAGRDSLAVAREHLEIHEGWLISNTGDFCPECKPKPGDTLHVYPTGDHIEHDTDSELATCACGPRMEAHHTPEGIISWVIVHHSLDGRETAEEAEAAAKAERIHWENFTTVRRAQWCHCEAPGSMPHIWLPSTAWGASDHDRVPPSLNWELRQFQDDARFAGIIPKPAGGEPNHPGMWTPDREAPDWLID